MKCIWIIFKKPVLTIQIVQDISIEIHIRDSIILALTSNMETVSYSEILMNVIS
jgi:hypothetical protein